MNILYLSLGREYGGTEKVIENLLDSFKNDLKNKITVVAMNNTRFFQVLKLKYSNNSNIEILGLLNSNKKIIRNIFLLRNLIKFKKFDVIHVHSIVSNLIFQLANIRLGNKSIITVHSRSDFDRKRNIKGILMNNLEIFLLNRNTEIVCVSNSIKEYLLEKGLSKNIEVIHNGIYGINQKASHLQIEKFKVKYSKVDSLLLIYIGRLTEVKGIYNLISIIKKISKKNKNVDFLVLGEGELKLMFDEEIEKKQLKNVKLLGFQNQIKDYLPYCDFLIMPSNMEGIPITILEAMSCSIPCIASNVGGIPEIINEKNGVLYNNNNLDYIIEKIDYYEKNRKLIDNLKNKAYKDFNEKWNINKFIQKYKERYILLSKK
ncbi:glycosyltransferase family 4 protein [Clostridium perfringens]|uniref:glycosyltransferase family 4 protein n=1 Tax=Clostridium perfringens TaxID=1502 RepID=UPI0013E3E01C|nr:glycosyltransferase family 4 protein [Clostridium perfringens]NGT96810.1 glycosyltransferase family 4 protein [Clostridium perfringens]